MLLVQKIYITISVFKLNGIQYGIQKNNFHKFVGHNEK